MFSKFLVAAASFFIMTDRGDYWSDHTISDETKEVIDDVPVSVDFSTLKNQKVLLLVHGYNNTAVEALNTYQTIRQHVDEHNLYDTIIGYLWPSGDESLEYFSAEKNTKELASRVQGHLQEIFQNASHFDILAHSMGNRLILEALQKSSSPKALVRNFYSLAPAVKDKDIEEGHPYYSSVSQCEKMFVFHSDEDDVLKYDFFLAEHAKALGYEGQDTPQKEPKNVQFIDCTSFVDGHSAYFTVDPLYAFFKNQQAGQTNSAMNVKLLIDGLVSKK